MLNLIDRKKKPKKDVLFIHGAWSSGHAFAYIQHRLEGHPNLGAILAPTYDIQRDSLTKIIDAKRFILEQVAMRPTVVVGHSLGGIIAMHLHDSVYCDSIVTVSSPLDGMRFNLFIRNMIAWRSPYLVDAFTDSSLIRDMHRREYYKPIDQVITTNGFSPMISERNDGVVTVSSQTRWRPGVATPHHVHVNHTEILVADYLLHLVTNHLERVSECS